jgi:hypothetical protein
MRIQEQHSPMPWRISRAGDGPRERNLITDAGGTVIAEVVHTNIAWEEFEYNTLIMASAPNLLDTLVQIANPDQAKLNTSAFALQAMAKEAIYNLCRLAFAKDGEE